MIDKWFEEDINLVLSSHNRVVITDANGEGIFLLKYLPQGCVLLHASDLLSEIEAKYRAEKESPDKKVVFYTSIKHNELTFLLEYAETCGWINLNDMEEYIKAKLYKKLKLNASLERAELLLAAKLSLGKDEKWWKGVVEGIITPLELEKNLLQFLNNPEKIAEQMDVDVWNVFQTEVYKIMGKPITNQSVEMFAKEVTLTLLNGLVTDSIHPVLLAVYYQWVDSVELQKSLEVALQNYSLPADIDLTQCHLDHCFKEADAYCFQVIGESLAKGERDNSLIDRINERMKSKKADSFKPLWWNGLLELLRYQPKSINKIVSLKEFCSYYDKYFAPLDAAMRICYVYWLNEPEKLKPWQHYYEQLNAVLLDKWFSLQDEYADTQQGYLKRIFSHTVCRTAVIVCDGVRLEIANRIVTKLPKEIKVDRALGLAALPTVTENGMSALYMGNHIVVEDKSKREIALLQECPDIVMLPLEKLNTGITADKLLLTYGEIDYVSEKQQQEALKAFDVYESYLSEKIRALFAMGFEDVHLTSDHGFVLTGILTTADKIQVPTMATLKKEERYLLSKEKVTIANTIEREVGYKEFLYQYYAKNDKPFVTTGAYGYAHGGYTPQEVIIPQFRCYQDKNKIDGLKVCIFNKIDLQAVVGNTFIVKLQGVGTQGNLFEAERKIKCQLFSQGTLVQESAILSIRAGDVVNQEFEWKGVDTFTFVIIDCQTTQQLDSCEIEQSKSRDFGDLF